MTPSSIETLTAAALVFRGLVATIPDHAWAGPGLGAWDLRALVGHTSRSLITVETYLAVPAAAVEVEGPAEYVATIGTVDHSAVVERGRAAGLVLGDDPIGYVTDLTARVPALAADALRDGADPLITTIFGGMLLSRYLPTRTFELVAHGIDITTALGRPAPDFPTAVLREAAGLAAEAGVLAGRGPELVRALTGRQALPAGFSVV